MRRSFLCGCVAAHRSRPKKARLPLTRVCILSVGEVFGLLCCYVRVEPCRVTSVELVGYLWGIYFVASTTEALCANARPIHF
jgi:hypothetical protein